MSSTPHGDDRRVFEEVAAEVIDPVRRYLWRRTDPATADDVLSETLLVLWRRARDVPAERVPWAIGVARLQLANAVRSQRRQERVAQKIIDIDPPRASYDPAEEDAEADRVRSILASLKPADAEILRLWVWEDLEPRQIADVLGVSVNAATVRLHRARRRFAVAFGKDPARAGHGEVKEGETL